MAYFFELSHPKHYYQFRHVIKQLISNGHSVFVLARDKDVLLDILKEESIPFFVLGKHGKSLLQKILALPLLYYNYCKLIIRYRPDVIISKASPYAVLAKVFFNKKTVITPDSEVVSLTNRFVAPNSTLVLTPQTFGIEFGVNHQRFKGFFEDFYLHPTVFIPNKILVNKLGIDTKHPYFILRFISWQANHDIGKFGFSLSEKIQLVEKLLPYGKVYISSESELPASLLPFRLKIPPSAMHQVLHFATLYIGDSQTMATEASLLGTPSIRYNSFVGPNDMTNFKVLEQEHHLMYNFNQFESVLSCVYLLLEDESLKQRWLEKRSEYYKRCENPNQVMVSILENV